MNYLKPQLRDDYDYVVRTFNPSDYRIDNCLSELDVLKAHYILSDFFLDKGEEVRFGVLNFNMLASAVSRQYVEFSGEQKWTDPFHRMATLAFGLTKDHAFHDGNKRTALLSILLGLNMQKRELNVPKSYLEILMVRIAANELNRYKAFKQYVNKPDAEILFIADFIRHNTRRIDKEVHSLTYAEFDTKLRQFKVWLENLGFLLQKALEIPAIK